MLFDIWNMVASYHSISNSRHIINFSGFLAYFQAIFRKVIENGYLPSTKHLERYPKPYILISCFNCS